MVAADAAFSSEPRARAGRSESQSRAASAGGCCGGGATVLQQSLGQQMQGDCGGEVASVVNAMFNDQEVPDGRKESPDGPWYFVMPLFDPPRHDSAETIRRALNLGVHVKMITCDQLAIVKETRRRLRMGTNKYPSSTLLGHNKDESIAALLVDLIEKADGFAGVFPGCHSPHPTEVS